jgi:uncharacterized damage-inducible protein DinB
MPMNAKYAMKASLDSTMFMTKMFLEDLSDADILVRPVPGANHIAWQLGHLIVTEANIAKAIPDAKAAELPGDFAAKYAKETAGIDAPAAFHKKAELLAAYDKVRLATLATLDALPEAALDTPTTGPMAKHMPTYGSLFTLLANHTMMHAGQFTVVRRKLGKPVLF